MLGFRVWDIEKKEFCKNNFGSDWCQWCIRDDGMFCYRGDDFLEEYQEERYYPTQSTGLKDATEKAIFVGDIVHNKNKVIDKHGNCELFIVNKPFLLHHKLDLSEDDISIKIESINIIGNIFESEGFLRGLNDYVFKEFTR